MCAVIKIVVLVCLAAATISVYNVRLEQTSTVQSSIHNTEVEQEVEQDGSANYAAYLYCLQSDEAPLEWCRQSYPTLERFQIHTCSLGACKLVDQTVGIEKPLQFCAHCIFDANW